ncbi:hypothetical protein M9H77_28162 [Catharanthus roseus]|uniref:Uncharacterized protein n=1 Tax=Catharanthus roseus TaxID=4058 RepID=A0ACC0AGR8_CATRO|nr:hypothetical protein M9H77_28162 [Catharanthus roseus]
MALCCQLRIHHPLRTIILDGIGISRESTSAIQQIVELDDMATGMIQGHPSSPTQIEPILDHGARGVKRGARRLPGGGARGGRALAPPHSGRRGQVNPGRRAKRGEGSGGREREDHGDPFDNPDLDMPSLSLVLTPPAQSHPGGLGTSYAPLPPSLSNNTTVDDEDDEIDHSDEDYVVSSETELDDNNDTKEEELQTPVNPIKENKLA